MKKKLDRRTFLRGAGGVALGLPLLEAMLPARQARAQTMTAPRRVVFSFQANGDQIARRMATKHETNFVFDEFLSPLEPYRSEVLILDGLDKRYGRMTREERADAHQQGGSCLAPWPSGTGSFPVGGEDRTIGYVMGPSADHAIGERVLQANPSMPHRHLVYRVGQRGNNIWNLHSHGGPQGAQNPIPPETDPWAAYARLFSGLDDGAERDAIVKRLAKKESALDLVLDEMTSLSSRLGADDRRRLERHGDSLRDIERTLVQPDVGNLSCRAISTGMALDPYDDDNHAVVGQLFFRIITLALACDITRVVQFNWSGNTSNRVYRNLNLSEGHHDLSHTSTGPAFGSIRSIHRHLWSQNVQFYEMLKEVDELGGSLWDNTLVVHWNELGQGDSHDTSNTLCVLAGGGGGYFRMGRYLDLTRQTARGFSDMLVSCFHYMGFEDVQRFGDPRLATGGPIPGLV